MVQPCTKGTQIENGGWGYGGVGLGRILKGVPHPNYYAHGARHARQRCRLDSITRTGTLPLSFFRPSTPKDAEYQSTKQKSPSRG